MTRPHVENMAAIRALLPAAEATDASQLDVLTGRWLKELSAVVAGQQVVAVVGNDTITELDAAPDVEGLAADIRDLIETVPDVTAYLIARKAGVKSDTVHRLLNGAQCHRTTRMTLANSVNEIRRAAATGAAIKFVNANSGKLVTRRISPISKPAKDAAPVEETVSPVQSPFWQRVLQMAPDNPVDFVVDLFGLRWGDVETALADDTVPHGLDEEVAAAWARG